MVLFNNHAWFLSLEFTGQIFGYQPNYKLLADVKFSLLFVNRQLKAIPVAFLYLVVILDLVRARGFSQSDDPPGHVILIFEKNVQDFTLDKVSLLLQKQTLLSLRWLPQINTERVKHLIFGTLAILVCFEAAFQLILNCGKLFNEDSGSEDMHFHVRLTVYILIQVQIRVRKHQEYGLLVALKRLNKGRT